MVEKLDSLPTPTGKNKKDEKRLLMMMDAFKEDDTMTLGSKSPGKKHNTLFEIEDLDGAGDGDGSFSVP